MTDVCDPSSGDDCRDEERDAPAIANMPSVRRLLRALSIFWLKRPPKRQRIIRLHLMSAYLLKDIGLERLEDEESVRRLIDRSGEEG
jgi:uncharacterized protein YjiS (DUF1127 family)